MIRVNEAARVQLEQHIIRLKDAVEGGNKKGAHGGKVFDPQLWSEQLGDEINEVQLGDFVGPQVDNLLDSDLDGLRFIIRTPLTFSRELALKIRQLVGGRSASDTSGRPTQFKTIKDLRSALKILRYQGHLRNILGAVYDEAIEVLKIEFEVQRI